MKPDVLIPCPTSFDEAYNRQCWPEFSAAVKEAGATPRMVPLDIKESELRRMEENACAVVLPGSGADVSPASYGHETQPETNLADAPRERIDRALLDLAYRAQLPTLAVCFGMQSLNVYRGGTLVQHLFPLPTNHKAGRSVVGAHATILSKTSRLGGLLASAADVAPDGQDGFLRLMVNSSHHQAVSAAGDGLSVVGRSAEDAVVEAVEDPAHPFMLGVQWHPERTWQQSHASRLLFEALVGAARHHA